MAINPTFWWLTTNPKFTTLILSKITLKNAHT